jgi:hypothetical protein
VQNTESGESIATEVDTRRALLERSGRPGVPIRKVFVQTPRKVATDPNNLAGPLSEFVRRGDLRGLHAYLMILATTSSGASADGWSTTLPIMVWARAFDTTVNAERSAAATAVSKVLHRLVDRRLIERRRSGRERRVRVTLLREDASGEPYLRPVGTSLSDRFLTLNHAFWLDGWHDRLKLPGLAMLLVALHESGPNKPVFQLPSEHAPKWYGWSADTTERGLAELRDHDLLNSVTRIRKEPLSASGYGRVNDYYLQPPFGNPDPAALLAGLAAKLEIPV